LLSDIESQDVLQKTFVLNLIGYINHLISAFRISHHLSYLHNITAYDLQSALVIDIDGEGTIYLIEPPYAPPDMSGEEITKVLGTMTSMVLYPSFYLVDEFYFSALAEMGKENMNRFIVDIETSFEIFIRTVLRLVLVKDNATDEEIKKIESLPFRNAVEQHFAKRLNVDLSFDKNPAMIDWYQNVYTPRNYVVHKGTPIGHSVAEKAFESHENVRKYITNLLIEREYMNQNGEVDMALVWGDKVYPEYSSDIIDKMKREGVIPEFCEFGDPDSN